MDIFRKQIESKVVTKTELEEAIDKFKRIEDRRKLLEIVLERPTTVTNNNGHVIDLYFLTDKEMQAYKDLVPPRVR